MTPSEIRPGMVFGKWEVLKYNGKRKNGVKKFLCRCSVCGVERDVNGYALTTGKSTACSKRCALAIEKGTRFGKWTVQGIDKAKPGYYLCKCDCGTEKSVYGGNLTTGKSKSCGCARAKMHSKKFKKQAESHIGETFGWLTVDSVEKRPDPNKPGHNRYYYHCTCKCGNKKVVSGVDLLSGNTTSCGCINSKVNELMDKLLTRENVPFKREYWFAECRDKKPLPFDFAIFNEQEELIGLMELNGSLHYSTSGTGWDTPDRLIVQKKHDYLKRKFCEDNQIPFLVIPYQYFNGNEMEKFLKTSDFWEIITKNFND